MTDRHAGYVVTLETPLREDDAEATLAAIRQIRGVLTVEPIINDPVLEMVTDSRARRELAAEVLALHRKVIRRDGISRV